MQLINVSTIKGHGSTKKGEKKEETLPIYRQVLSGVVAVLSNLLIKTGMVIFN